MEVAPEGDPFVLGVFLEFFVAEEEGKDVDLEGFLAGVECGGGEGPDFFDGLVAHGEAADGNAFAVDHQSAAGAFVMAVELVWVTEVEGEVEAAVGIHLGWLYAVAALGRLFVALLEFWAECSGEFADGIGFESFEFCGLRVFLEPKFEDGRVFEDADEYGRAEFQAAVG